MEACLKIREDVSNMINMIENCDRQTYMAMVEASNNTTWMWAHSIYGPIKEVVHDDWKRTSRNLKHDIEVRVRMSHGSFLDQIQVQVDRSQLEHE